MKNKSQVDLKIHIRILHQFYIDCIPLSETLSEIDAAEWPYDVPINVSIVCMHVVANDRGDLYK